METVSPDEWRKQLEVNVIGQLAVTQAVLPRLRRVAGPGGVHLQPQRQGVLPADGCLQCVEVRVGGGRRRAANGAAAVAVFRWSLVEPAQTDTDMWRTADAMVEETEAALTPEHRALYARHIAGMKKFIPVSQRMAVAAGEGVRRRRGGAHCPSAARPLRRRHRPQAAGGLDDEPADPSPRPGAADGVRPAIGMDVFVKRSAGAPAALLRLRSRWAAMAFGCGRRCACARVIGSRRAVLTLERLDCGGAVPGGCAGVRSPACRDPRCGSVAFGAGPDGWSGPGLLRAAVAAAADVVDRPSTAGASSMPSERLAPMADAAASRLSAGRPRCGRRRHSAL